MTLLSVAERVVRVIDWAAAGEFTLALSAAFLLVGALCVLAARGLQRRTSWRWWIQLAPYPAFVVLFSIALRVGGAGVAVGKLVLCHP